MISIISPLHIEGKYVEDSTGNNITLKGVVYGRFIDSPYGDWQLPSGSVEWTTWNASAAGETLDAMKSWGSNVVRVMFTTAWWLNNVGGFRTSIQTFISMAAQRGMYVDLCPWRNNATGTAPGNLPWAPYDPNNNILNSSTDFVNFWASMASALGNNPNVLFELYNEPQGNSTTWFSVVQSTITAIRSTGSTNIIVVQHGYGVGVDFAGFSRFNSGSRVGAIYTLDWINNYPLYDPTNNILYSSHLYRTSFYESSWNYSEIYSPTWVNFTSNDMLWALNITGVLNNPHPLWIGEIGCSNWASDQTTERAWYDSSLSMLDNSTVGTVGYAGWDFWSNGEQWGLLNGAANYAPTSAGQILINHMTLAS